MSVYPGVRIVAFLRRESNARKKVVDPFDQHRSEFRHFGDNPMVLAEILPHSNVFRLVADVHCKIGRLQVNRNECLCVQA